MPGQIDANYASPGLRWGLLLEDHPGAEYRFELKTGAEVPGSPIPESYGGKRSFCVATIIFPPGSGLVPVIATKSVADEGTPDEWNVLCTKTLGRALKRAGYPDNLQDLKALVLWRQRNAEVSAITASGSAPLALGRGEAVTKALEEAATTSPADRGGDDDSDEDAPPHPETLAALREAYGDLSGPRQKEARERAKAKGVDLLHPDTDQQARRITGWLLTLAEGGDADDEVVEGEVVDDEPTVDPETGEVLTGDAAMVAELAGGLTAKERKLYDGYLATIGALPNPGDMTEEQIHSVLEWFESSQEGAA